MTVKLSFCSHETVLYTVLRLDYNNLIAVALHVRNFLNSIVYFDACCLINCRLPKCIFLLLFMSPSDEASKMF